MNHITEAVLSQKVKVIPMEIWCRTCGYFRPISGQNKGKLEEFHERIYLDINKALNKELKGDYFENRKESLEQCG